MKIDSLLKSLVEKGGSDLHLKVDSPPVMRIRRQLIVQDGPPLAPEETREIAYNLMGEKMQRRFEELNEADFAYSQSKNARFRVNVFRQRGSVGIVIRVVRTIIPSLEELNLPNILEKIAMYERGIVLVTGTSSCGKTTTLAAMTNYLNEHKSCHIITVENPIEYLHQDKKSIINQREVGIDTDSFSLALRHVVRQDPDIILIGEMRDSESFLAALAASETGHLVFSTLHAGETAQVFDRILDFFPTSQHEQVRMLLSLNLRAVTCQRLLRQASGEGMIPAVEIMLATPTVVKLIRENRLAKLYHAIQNETEVGMQTFNQSLVKLVKENKVTLAEALAKSSNPEELKMNLKGIFLDEDRHLMGEVKR